MYPVGHSELGFSHDKVVVFHSNPIEQLLHAPFAQEFQLEKFQGTNVT